LPLGACCRNADCPAGSTAGTYACLSNVCVLTCSVGYQLCGSSCISSAACCATVD
jgi:hypothetical protein